jgi:hypothetical protein
MFRPRLGFDALLRITEMAALQFVFYFFYMLVVMVLDYFAWLPYTNEQLVNFAVVQMWSNLGRIAAAGQFIGGVAAALVFSFLEGRHRNALDFISTIFGIHLLFISAVRYFPKSFVWWFCYVANWGVATLAAETISLRFEMQDINLDVVRPAVLERVKDSDALL